MGKPRRISPNSLSHRPMPHPSAVRTERETGLLRAPVYIKHNSPDLPYRVANEYICSRLGQSLIPVPPHALMRFEHGEYCFAILDFNSEKSLLLPISPEACVAFDSRLWQRDRAIRRAHWQPRSPRRQFENGRSVSTEANRGI